MASSREKGGATGQGRGASRVSPAAPATTDSHSPSLSAFKVFLTVSAFLGGLYYASQFYPRPSQPLSNLATLPPQVQVIDQKSFNVLPAVPPPLEFNGTTPFVPPGHTLESLHAKPFHVYDEAFVSILGPDPTLSLIAKSDVDPLFHEAVVWSRSTDEMFFVQNAGAKDAGTGLAKSGIIEKISLADAAAVAASSLHMSRAEKRAGNFVPVTTVDSTPQVINPNGGTNFRGQLLFAGEGQGDHLTSALWMMNPRPPYNTTVLINNFFGRQFNSLNDLAVHPRSRDVYFTDTLYGYLQDFRPVPGLRNQVYRWREATGALTVVADGFALPNGITFSPDGAYAYVTDTGLHHGYYGNNFSDPATIYRFDVRKDGTFENRKTFAYVDSIVPDGIHCDTKGNVYAGCGDGVSVWNPSGTLLGKIFLGTVAANFQFAGTGRMVICAETELYYATLGASGAVVESEM